MPEYIKPKWINMFSDLVRPVGVSLMFFFITILPLICALLELGIRGTGSVLAGVLAGYFKAIPDVFYTTIQVLFLGFVAGKSAEAVTGKITEGKLAAAQIQGNGPNDSTV
jgi:hypothetical protein